MPKAGIWRQLPWRDESIGVALVLALAVQVFAGLSLRGLFADGAFFVTQIVSEHSFFIPAPSRWMSTVLYELPALAAVELGMDTPGEVALIYSLATNVMPGAILLLCRAALPAAESRYLVFPAFVYFAGTLSAQFASTVEGLIAVPYIWLIFYLILFGVLSPARLCLILLLSIGTIRMHEQMSFLAPFLVVASGFRWRELTTPAQRLILGLAVVAMLVSTAFGAYPALYPAMHYPAERAQLVQGLLDLSWLYMPEWGYNLPAAFGLAAAVAILVCIALPRIARATAAIFSIVVVALAIAAFRVDVLTFPFGQFVARYNAAFLSFPLMILVLIARCVPGAFQRVAPLPVCCVVVMLGVSTSLWHIQASEKWSSYVSQFRSVLASGNGIIPATALDGPDAHSALLARMMSWNWTNPDLSILVLPRRCMTSVVDNPPGDGWRPHRLQDLKTMPRIAGLTYTYLLPPEMQASACPPVNTTGGG